MSNFGNIPPLFGDRRKSPISGAAVAPSTGLFGMPAPGTIGSATSAGFVVPSPAPVFSGSVDSGQSGSLFSGASDSGSRSLFGQGGTVPPGPGQPPSTFRMSSSLFGAAPASSGSSSGTAPASSASVTTNLFSGATNTSANVFGKKTSPSKSEVGDGGAQFGTLFGPSDSSESKSSGFASFQPKQVFGAKMSPPASTNIPDPFKKGTSTVSAGASLFGAGDGSAKPKPAGTALFGKPQKPAASGIFGGSQSASNTGFGMLGSQVKRSAGTRPNTPVFEEEDQENPEDQTDDVDELHDDYNEEFVDSHPQAFVDSHPQPVPSLFSGGIKDRLGPSVFSKPEPRPADLGPFDKRSAADVPLEDLEAKRKTIFSKPPPADKRPADADADEEQKPKKKVGATARFLAENTADTETSGLKKKLKRTVSNEELATLTSIRCEQVPEDLNKAAIMTEHFSKFGQVVKAVPNLKKGTCLIKFAHHSEAKLAKSKGKFVSEELVIGHIFYSKASPSRTKRKVDSVEAEELAAMGTGAAGFDTDIFGSTESRIKPAKKVFSLTKSLQQTQKPAAQKPAPVADNFNASKDASANECLRIMKQQAITDEERWKVLDARDKYIKIKFPKTQLRSGLEIEDMNLIGTCPDICPEKERYGRSAKNQLRWYEKIGGRLNHLTAVKEHSRSAADQDVPPPHELRPARVLDRTMNFLMCNIVDRIDHMSGTMEDWFNFISELNLGGCVPADPWSQFYVDGDGRTEETVGDWYEYMWSVTRAIRKDITQQNLSDLVSVSIVEKCSRFHIFCAERLIEESAFNFDRKLNDENLTKCLRTLKHMYHDLREAGTHCPNECEFRAYDVLMNLNEGDTLREIQALPKEIQENPKVKFALECFKALESNNYIKFFKLVKKAEYLEACLMKRYFYQVRRLALEIILKAFVPGKNLIEIPVSKICHWLAFESDMDCAKFFRLHGVESEDGIFFMERASLMYPENPPPMIRSKLLIESKKLVSYGEVVNGGPLGENPYLEYFPHDSFNDAGFLKTESYDGKDQIVMMTEEEIRQAEVEEARRQHHLVVAEDLISELEEDILDEEIEKVSDTVLQDIEDEKNSIDLFETLKEEAIEEMIQSVSKEVLKKAKNDLIALKLVEEERAQAEADVCAEIIDNWTMDLIKDVAEEQMKEVNSERKLQNYLKHASKFADDAIDKFVAESVVEIAKEVHAEIGKEEAIKVELFAKNMKIKMTRKVFREWKRLASKTRRQKEVIVNFPSTAANLPIEKQNERLGGKIPRSKVPIGSVITRRKEIDIMMQTRDLELCFTENAILEPFNLVKMMKDCLTNKQKTFLKMIFATPDLADVGPESGSTPRVSSSIHKPFVEMIRRKFRNAVHVEEENMSVCVKDVNASEISKIKSGGGHRKDVFGGVNAILFACLDGTETMEESRDRLHELLQLKSTILAAPLLVLSSYGLEETSSGLGLQQLLSSGLVAHYNVVQVTPGLFNIDQIVRINQSIRHLINLAPQDLAPGFARSSFTDFVEDFFVGKIFSAFFANLAARRAEDLPHRSAADLIGLFNYGLDHLAATLQDPVLAEVIWPPQLCPETPADTASLLTCLERLRLPELVVHDCDSWRNIVDQVLVYLDQLRGVRGPDTSVTASALRRQLARSYRSYTSQCQSAMLVSGDTSLPLAPPPTQLLPWADLVHSLATYQLSKLSHWHYTAQGGTVPPGTTGHVWYQVSTLESWSPPPSWTRGLGRTRTNASFGAGEVSGQSVTDIINVSIGEARDRSLVEAATICENASINPTLEKAIKEEQQSSLRFERLLEEAVKDRNPPTCLAIVSPDKSAKPLPAFLQKKPSPKRKKTINSPTPAKSVRLDIEQKCGGLKTALNLEKEEMEKLERKIADALK